MGMDVRTMPSGSLVRVTSFSIRAVMFASSADCSAARAPGTNWGCADRPWSIASLQPAGAVKSMRSKIACRHSPALVPRGKRRMSSGAMSGGGAPTLFATSAIRASWSFAAVSLFASLERPEKLLKRHAGAIAFGGGRAARVSGSGLASATGVPRCSGSGARARWGYSRVARACHAAAMSAGDRLPSSQLCGVSLPPATSQLRRLFVLSAVVGLPKLIDV